MAVLSDGDRASVWTDLMRRLSNERQSIGITKAELRAAVNAVDQWVDDNAASFNSAIPQPARGSLNAEQKAMLLLYVVSKRFEAE